MNSSNAKWQTFKQEINLIDFACAYGYTINKKKSTKHSVCLSKENADKIIVSRKNGVWVYFSVFDTKDRGTIVDFVQHKLQKSYAEIFNLLDGWKGTSSFTSYAIPETPVYNQERIQRIFNQCYPVKKHSYLTQRGICESVLDTGRFQQTVFIDTFHNAVFPQYKNGNISALELKNEKLHVFVKGSEKTFWKSNRFLSDTQLCIAETSIDALSYQKLFDVKNTFYIATSGSPSKHQISVMLGVMKEFEQITCIVDNDTGGDRLFERLNEALEYSEMDGHICRHSPNHRGEDRNDVLRATLS